LYYHFFSRPVKHKPAVVKIYLIFFFSGQNCPPCLEIIDSLNHLGPPCQVIGLVPREELKSASRLRNLLGVKFELFPLEEFSRFRPNYYPSLFGMNKKGDILFILPGLPGGKTYFSTFLKTFLARAEPIL